MDIQKELQSLFKAPYFTPEDVRALNINPGILSYYEGKGLIERLERGLYKGVEVENDDLPFQYEDLIYVALSIKDCAICLISALSMYELTEEIPRAYWLAIPNSRKPSKRDDIRSIRFRDMELGRTTIKYGDIEVPIFDRERTVVDAVKMLSREVGVKAVRMYLAGDGFKPDIPKLSRYADIRGVPKIHYYMEALLV